MVLGLAQAGDDASRAARLAAVLGTFDAAAIDRDGARVLGLALQELLEPDRLAVELFADIDTPATRWTLEPDPEPATSGASARELPRRGVSRDRPASDVPAEAGRAAAELRVDVACRGRELGRVVLGWRGRATVDAATSTVAELVCRQAALAIDGARAAARERAARRRTDALVEAIGAVSAGGGDDLDATLESLATQARLVLGARDVTVNLATRVGDEVRFVRRRVSAVAAETTRHSRISSALPPSTLMREAIVRGQPVTTPDFRFDPGRHLWQESALPAAISSLSLPLVAGDEIVGVLFVDWTNRRAVDRDDVALAQAFARYAATSLWTARRLHDARSHGETIAAAHQQLEGIFDSAADAIVVFDRERRIVQLNRSASVLLGSFAPDRAPQSTHAQLCRDLGPLTIATSGDAATLLSRALAGHESTGAAVLRDARGADRRVHTHAAPLREADGSVRGAVIIVRDMTDASTSEPAIRPAGGIAQYDEIGDVVAARIDLAATVEELAALARRLRALTEPGVDARSHVAPPRSRPARSRRGGRGAAPTTWREREIGTVLSLTVARAMWERAWKWDLSAGGRFQARANEIRLWSRAIDRETATPIGRITIAWRRPTSEQATISSIGWDTRHSTEAELRQAIEFLTAGAGTT